MEAKLSRHWASMGRMKAITTRRFKIEGDFELVFCIWLDSAPSFMHMDKDMFESCYSGGHSPRQSLQALSETTPWVSRVGHTGHRRRENGGEKCRSPEKKTLRGTQIHFSSFSEQKDVILCY